MVPPPPLSPVVVPPEPPGEVPPVEPPAPAVQAIVLPESPQVPAASSTVPPCPANGDSREEGYRDRVDISAIRRS